MLLYEKGGFVMYYKKKFVVAVILLLLSMLMISSLVYFGEKYIDKFLLLLVFVCVTSPLIGYGCSYAGARNENKLFLLSSIFFYNLFFASFIMGFNKGRNIPINYTEVVGFAIYAFILIAILYFLSLKNTSGIIGAVFVILSIAVGYALFEFSFISMDTMIYSLVIGGFVICNYFTSLTSMKKYDSMLKAISIGYGNIFWFVFELMTISIFRKPLPQIEEDSDQENQNNELY